MADTLNNFLRELQFGKLEKRVKSHLTKVYTSMGLSLIACAIGSYLHMANIFTAGILTFFLTLAGLIALVVMTPTAENSPTRFGLLMGISLLVGVNEGPLLDFAIHLDPSLVVTAFLATSLVFICFTLSALLSEDRKWLAIGGILSSGLSWLILFGLLNIFLKSQLLFDIKLYIGLAIFCGYILYDTQLIVEKCRTGDDDYIGHCLMLFLDFINIFRRILILLSDKEVKKDRRRKD
jgi:Bax inhibitor 1